MFFWLVILGAWMGWVESVYGDKPRDIPETVSGSDAYMETLDKVPDIPEYLLRPELIPVEMPDKDTPDKADEFVRFVARSRR